MVWAFLFSKRSFEGWTKSILFQSGAFHDGRSQSFFKEELSEFNEVNPSVKEELSEFNEVNP
ncbi:MAG: hypothetical protein RLZ77_1822 [Bacteroidota bacterium]|jgi:hypothetical protein